MSRRESKSRLTVASYLAGNDIFVDSNVDIVASGHLAVKGAVLAGERGAGETRRRAAGGWLPAAPGHPGHASAWAFASGEMQHAAARRRGSAAGLHGLPPILIHVGDAGVTLDDSAQFAAKARAADRPGGEIQPESPSGSLVQD